MLEREFPPGAAEPDDAVSRRTFLKLMGASLALAGLTSCGQPTQPVAPFVRQPEDLTHGVPLLFATAMPFNGYGRGLVVRSNQGRPTKVEGNPLHPDSLGATNIFAQVAVLTLYDPERLKNVLRENTFSTWEDFLAAVAQPLQIEGLTGGAGLRILTETITSPTLTRQLNALLEQFPNARWVQYDPVMTNNGRAGRDWPSARVRATWAEGSAAEEFEQFWRDVLAAEVIPDTELPPLEITLQPGAIPPAAPTAAVTGLKLSLRPDPTIWDGSWANNAWLQEQHKPVIMAQGIRTLGQAKER